jgi:hypothetical protein
MSAAGKEDESVETSLRELMRQEEDRLEQLRLAKARIDRERAEAAREAEEARLRREREEHAELEAKKAAAVERARIEALAKPEPAPRVVVVEAPAPPPMASRFGAGFATGVAATVCAATIGWSFVGAPRIAHAAKLAEEARVELEEEKSHSRDVLTADEAVVASWKKETTRFVPRTIACGARRNRRKSRRNPTRRRRGPRGPSRRATRSTRSAATSE